MNTSNILAASLKRSQTVNIWAMLTCGALLALLTVIGFSSQAFAISDVAPDSSEYKSAGTHTRLALSNIPSTPNITTIRIPVYLRAPQTATNVSASMRLSDFYYPYGRSDFVADYRVWIPEGVVGGNTGVCTAPGTDNSSPNFKLNGFTWDRDNELWVKTLVLQLVDDTNRSNPCLNAAGNTSAGNRSDEALVEFKARINNFTYTNGGPDITTPASGNSWIAYATDGSSWFATDARHRGTGAANYELQLATPCEVTSIADGNGTISLRDLDSGTADNNNRNIDLNIYDRTTGKYLIETSSTRDATHYYTTGSKSSQNSVHELHMVFSPNHSYRLEIRNVYYWNILIYRFPFNNISYVNGCPGNTNGALTPGLNVTPGEDQVVEDGGVVTGSFIVDSTAPTASVANATNCVYYDDNTTYDGTEVSAAACQTGNYNRSPNQKGQVYSRPVTATLTPSRPYICFSWQINSTPTPNVDVDTTPMYECRLIGNAPRVHIWGNDLRVGSSFVGGTNLDSMVVGSISANSGSWVEYAITAPSSVGLLASQSGAINGSSADQLDWSKLTFANDGAICAFGCFVPDPTEMGKIPDIKNALTGASITTARTGPVSTADIGSVVGNLNDVAGSHVVTTNGTITISQNIVYRSTGLSSSQNIPQLILVGNNIDILPNVTRVDAWLIATDGTLNTCAGIDRDDLRSDSCQLPLRINGPVMASQLLLHRTYNNATDPNAAAETINLRGDAYVWANRFTKQNGSWQTTYTTELPPRY